MRKCLLGCRALRNSLRTIFVLLRALSTHVRFVPLQCGTWQWPASASSLYKQVHIPILTYTAIHGDYVVIRHLTSLYQIFAYPISTPLCLIMASAPTRIADDVSSRVWASIFQIYCKPIQMLTIFSAGGFTIFVK